MGAIVNLDNTHIYIGKIINAKKLIVKLPEENMDEIPWVKYSIKETDMRVKTASFTTPYQLDLTTGVYNVKIVSKLHENFVGFILSDDYTENTDGTYTYQCQDMSRQYQSKFEGIYPGTVTNHRIIRSLLTRNGVSSSAKITDELREIWGDVWSGLRPIGWYQGKLYGNPIATNMMENKPTLFIKNKTYIEVIREICHANGYVDVYFNEDGTLQLKPIAIKDWQNTGLRLSANEIASRQFKFDTTNAITDVEIQSTDNTKLGKYYSSKSVTGLDLSAFFGVQGTSVSNPQQTTSSNNKATTNATKKSADKKNTSNPDNPYKTKRKYLLIDADGGETASFLESIAKPIRAAGWKVDIDKNIGPGAHSRNYKKVKNGCYMNVYNGLCADTIHEMALSYYGGVIKKNGSVHCPAWDTRSWTSARRKKYRKSIEKVRNLQTAHDWNRSSSIGTLANPHKYMTDHGIKYCVGDSAGLIAKQFLAGGWVAYNKK